MWRVALLSILIGVAGCSWMDNRKVPIARSVTLGQETAEREVPSAPPLPVQLPIPSRKPAELAALWSFDPKQLIGLGFRDAEALLGEPVWRGERPPAKVWTYSGENCVLNIFFYADINTREFRSLTYEIKDGSPAEEEEQLTNQCLARLIRGT
ncbi:MAG: hypothetical protein ACREEE_14140 [Dongiaceae bacterium]